MRSLVVISSPDDGQSRVWAELAREGGASVLHIGAAEIGAGCEVVAGTSDAELRPESGPPLNVRDLDRCWYLRLPATTSDTTNSALWALHGALALWAHPEQRYFHSFSGYPSWLESSKLLHLSERPGLSSPTTRVVGGADGTDVDRSHTTIVKSISGTRSTVVAASDPRLVGSSRSLRCDGPTLIQDRVDGPAVKYHFYRTRAGRWAGFAVSVVSTAVDYRYGDHVMTATQTLDRWSAFAHELGQRLDCHFFDFDVIGPRGSEQFLEVNLSPVPTYYERALFEDRFPYSQAVLADWLAAS